MSNIFPSDTTQFEKCLWLKQGGTVGPGKPALKQDKCTPDTQVTHNLIYLRNTREHTKLSVKNIISLNSF